MDTRKVDSYEDFVAWRDSHDCEVVTVGDSMRYFTATPLDVLLQWWKRDRAEQNASNPPVATMGEAVARGRAWQADGSWAHPFDDGPASGPAEPLCRVCGAYSGGVQHVRRSV